MITVTSSDQNSSLHKTFWNLKLWNLNPATSRSFKVPWLLTSNHICKSDHWISKLKLVAQNACLLSGMYHDLRGCVFQSPVELFYKLYINIEISQAFILGVVICEFSNILRIAHKNIKKWLFFLKVSAGLAHISETETRLRLSLSETKTKTPRPDICKNGLKTKTETETWSRDYNTGCHGKSLWFKKLKFLF